MPPENDKSVSAGLLIDWRFSECPDCVYTYACEKGREQLKLCFVEDEISFEGNEKAYMVRWAIRKVLSSIVKKRKYPGAKIGSRQTISASELRRRIRASRNTEPMEPRFKGATLYCSDMEVFRRCKQSE